MSKPLAGLAEAVIILVMVACIAIACLRIDQTDSMARCQERHSFDTCHSALNR